MKKRGIALLLVVLMSLSLLTACSSPSSNENTDVTDEMQTQSPTEAPTEETTEVPTEAPTEPPTEAPTEPPTQKVHLVDTCDEKLCTGWYGDDLYTIVANYSEDYLGLHVEVGVIKNNEWVLEPTEEMPFVAKKYHDTDKASAGDVSYIGKGCFVSEKKEKSNTPNYIYTFFNAATGATYSTADNDYPRDLIWFIESDQESETIIHKSVRYGYFDFITLNKSDMTLGKISVPSDGQTLYFAGNISEGLFAVDSGFSNYPKYYFYDLQGNLVLDLSEYKTPFQIPYFSKGRCLLEIENDNGTEYIITIDTKGNVLKSREK